jgi:phage tail-like protein
VDRLSADGRATQPVIASNFSVTFQDLAKDYGLSGPDPDRIGFSRVSGISSKIETKTVVEGSGPVINRIPTGISYGEAIFERGVASSPMFGALLLWYNNIEKILANQISYDVRMTSEPGIGDIPIFIKKRDVTIQVPVDHRAYTRSAVVKRRNRPIAGKTYNFQIPPSSNRGSLGGNQDIKKVQVKLIKAWPSKLEFGKLDANKSEVWIYTMTMVYNGIEIE